MKNSIKYDDFSKLEIRVGRIMEAEMPEWSEKLIKYVISFGDEIGNKTLFSGIRGWYKPEDLVGKKVPVVVNMEPKKMGEYLSEGMVIMVDGSEKPVMIFLSDDAKEGEIIR